MGVSTWGLSWKHSIIFQNPAGAAPPVTDKIITESGDNIVTEGGDHVVDEDS